MAMTAWLAKLFHQLDLLIVEGPHLLAIEENSANQFIFLEHRHAQHRPHATEFDGCDDDWIALGITSRCCEVSDMDDLLGPGDARNDGFRSWPPISVLLQIFGICRHRTAYCRNFPGITIVSIRKSEFRLAHSHSVRQHGLEHRLQLARRARDDLEHL